MSCHKLVRKHSCNILINSSFIFSIRDKDSNDESSSEESSYESDDDSESTESSESEESKEEKKPRRKQETQSNKNITSQNNEATKTNEITTKTTPATSKSESAISATAPKSNLDLLLDLDTEISSTITPVLTPSLGGFLTPTVVVGGDQTQTAMYSPKTIQSVPPAYVSRADIPLLDRISGQGLNIIYRFTRSPHLFSPQMVNIALTFTNSHYEDITDIKVGKKTLPPGTQVHDFACIANLGPMCNLPGTLGIDFNDSLQSVGIEICHSLGKIK